MSKQTNTTKQILIAAGVWDTVAEDLSKRYSLARIREVVQYYALDANYDYPAPAIVRALENELTIPKTNKQEVSRLLKETNNELATN